MDAFSHIFAPIPEIEDNALFMTLLVAIGGGLLGFIPGAGGVLAGTFVGVDSGLMLHELFFNQPTPSDTASYLGTFTNITRSVYQDIAETLFRDGQYEWISADGSSSTSSDMASLLADGQNMQQSGDPKDFMDALVPTYERILLQQLLIFTWSNLEKDGHSHRPFIAFDNVPCDEVNEDEDNILQSKHFQELTELVSGITYENKCYYLLDGIPEHNSNAWSRSMCEPTSLRGETQETFEANSGIFAGLSLAIS